MCSERSCGATHCVGAGSWPLSVRTAGVIRNQLSLGLWLEAGCSQGRGEKSIRRMVVNMTITVLSRGIM